jgi:hypothetical protein
MHSEPGNNFDYFLKWIKISAVFCLAVWILVLPNGFLEVSIIHQSKFGIKKFVFCRDSVHENIPFWVNAVFYFKKCFPFCLFAVLESSKNRLLLYIEFWKNYFSIVKFLDFAVPYYRKHRLKITETYFVTSSLNLSPPKSAHRYLTILLQRYKKKSASPVSYYTDVI